MIHDEIVLILDDGSKYKQMLTRKIRELGVYSELHPGTLSAKDIQQMNPKAIILSGGADRSFDALDPEIFSLNIPILGIHTGMKWMVEYFGGSIKEKIDTGYKQKQITHVQLDDLFNGLPTSQHVWLNDAIEVEELPERFQIDAVSKDDTIVAMSDKNCQYYGVLFHPEVGETDYGDHILKRFLFQVSQCHGEWSMKQFIKKKVIDIQETVGDRQVLCALSGGVDSSVVAALMHRAIGDQLTCIFVDHGLLRKNEAKDVEKLFADDFNVHLIKVDARKRFLNNLKGVNDPEEKRKVIGNEFIYVFADEADQLKDIDFLAQGTLYTDIIESGSDTSETIKSHHNVGGLPDDMTFELIEPLNTLFKDEVRELGLELGLPHSIVWRQPFPGPGLAIRILGEVTEEKLCIVRESDAILREEIKAAGLERDIWQYFTILPNIRSVGVKNGERTYVHTIAIRAVTSVDGTTSKWARIPWDVLDNISNRIVEEIEQVNRVVYDITSKPPATIEWE